MKLPDGIRLLHFGQIDSTNAEARRLAETGERGPLWIWADEQTAGRGRLGRTWVSPPGNLHATLLFSTRATADIAAQLSFVAALAVHDLAGMLRPDAPTQIKWPNDVLLDGAKFCGILLEVVATHPTVLALGCGINIAHAPQGMPYPVTQLGAQFQPEPVLRIFAAMLAQRLTIWRDSEGFAAIREAWLERAGGLGREAVAADGTRGLFFGLAEDGALILERSDGSRRYIRAGEVRFAAFEELRRQP